MPKLKERSPREAVLARWPMPPDSSYPLLRREGGSFFYDESPYVGQVVEVGYSAVPSLYFNGTIVDSTDGTAMIAVGTGQVAGGEFVPLTLRCVPRPNGLLASWAVKSASGGQDHGST